MNNEKRTRIYILKGRALTEAERLDLCRLLIKAGYSARLGKEKKDGKNTYEHYIEFWED